MNIDNMKWIREPADYKISEKRIEITTVPTASSRTDNISVKLVKVNVNDAET